VELTSQSTTHTLTESERAELFRLQREHPRREFSGVDDQTLIWAIVAMVLVYGVIGGLEGAAWSDAIQSVLIVVLSVLLIPFAIAKLNLMHGLHGWSSFGRILHQELPSYYFSPFGSAQSAEFTWYFIVALSIMATLNVAVQANQLTANASARDELTAAIGFTTGTFIKRYLTVVWGFMALLCFALYGRQIQNSDLIWGYATRDLLGGLGLGLVGLMIASLLAALQSTAGTMMISSAALLTRNVYAPLFPHRTDAHYIKIGRMTGAVFLVSAALLCTAFSTVLDMLKFLWEFNAVVAASFWCGLKWRRATRPGAWASIGVAMVMFMLLPAALPTVLPGLRTNPVLLQTTRQRAIEQSYPASPRDVEERAREIREWRNPARPAPAPLAIGEPLRRAIVMPPKSLYWSQGISLVDGQPRGNGLLLVEMWIFTRIADLSANPYAMNETIRYAYRILLPFLVLIVVSLATARDDSERARNFFLKMRTLVRPDRAEDHRALAAAIAAPATTEASLLFPRSQFEFFKWSRRDTVGFLACIGVAFSVVGFLYLLLTFQ
jgi:SSS family solute:Na+ symporter